jgi:ComF family protein
MAPAPQPKGRLNTAARAAGRLVEALLAALLPADCFLCEQPLPFRQEGGVCLPCWQRLSWAPGFRPRRGPLQALLWAADHDGPIRRLVHGLKFADMDYLAPALGRSMATRLAPLLVAQSPDLIVPVPLHYWRRYRRGYNQAERLARAIALRTGVPLDTRALRRRHGGRQLGLSRRERLRSLAGCFAARPGRACGRTILLVDDVVTTGATLEACARALLAGGARRVVGCVLARTPRNR